MGVFVNRCDRYFSLLVLNSDRSLYLLDISTQRCLLVHLQFKTPIHGLDRRVLLGQKLS
jgi:hypothetical protein